MFKNNVFKINVDTKDWLKRAAIRAVKTMSQTAIATISTGAVIESVDWKMVASASLLAGILSILTSVAGIPEVREGTETNPQKTKEMEE